jgi:hypothetical protein
MGRDGSDNLRVGTVWLVDSPFLRLMVLKLPVLDWATNAHIILIYT